MIVETLLLSAVLSASPRRCEAGERVFSLLGPEPPTMQIITIGHEASILYGASVEEAVAKDIGLVSDVRSIFVERAENNLLVWIALDNPTETVRDRVFQKQADIIDGFPEVSFDFNVVSARFNDPREFASEAKQVYSRQ